MFLFKMFCINMEYYPWPCLALVCPTRPLWGCWPSIIQPPVFSLHSLRVLNTRMMGTRGLSTYLHNTHIVWIYHLTFRYTRKCNRTPIRALNCWSQTLNFNPYYHQHRYALKQHIMLKDRQFDLKTNFDCLWFKHFASSGIIFGCESSPISRNVRSSVRQSVHALVDKCKVRPIKVQ